MDTSKARIAALAATITAVGIAGVSVPASPAAQSGDAATISMVAKGKTGKFSGAPKTIARGARLTISNESNPKQIGPHTFSIVEADLVPAKKDWRKCGEKLQLICGTIAKAHKINMKTFEIGKPNVDVGRKGWDTAFGKKGDTWFTEAEGDTTSRKVTAKAGTTLTYFCAVHPNMSGKLKVTG